MHTARTFAGTAAGIEGLQHVLAVRIPELLLSGLSRESIGEYAGEAIAGTLDCLRRAQRPVLLLTAYTTAAVWASLTAYDPAVVIGALEGPRAGARVLVAESEARGNPEPLAAWRPVPGSRGEHFEIG